MESNWVFGRRSGQRQAHSHRYNRQATVCFCLSVVAPPRHESPEYFTRGRRSCPADGLGVRVQFLLTYEIESESGLTPGLDLVGKPAASAAEPTGNYIYIVLTPCGFGVQVHIEASRARTAARA
uniref:Uncharacterized protein n=1 Tax=Ananas comosus var. bracteatus TaxID=296719 RepID=A0A6V7PG92_ANACO|nr:unnamed protein product [Ananas comosus var. bracteatus]